MSYFSSLSLNFGLNLVHVVKSVITRRTQTSFVTASRYEVRSLRCEPLALPSSEPQPSVTEQLSVDFSVPSISVKDEVPVSSSNIEKEPLIIISPLANESSSQSAVLPNILVKAALEPLATQPKHASTTFSSTSSPSPFLAFLEASHLEASNRLLAEKSKSKPLDLGCAQFNSAYYRRHLPPALPHLSTRNTPKKPFRWRTTLDAIMKESGEECDEILDELVEESGTKSNQDISGSSHSRSSSISSDLTCIESPVLVPVSSVGELKEDPSSKDPTNILILQEPLFNHPDVTPIRPSPSSFSSCKQSSFLDFIQSSNQEMINRMQEDKFKTSTLDVGCSQFNSAYYRRHLPSSLPPLKSNRTFCWKSKLDQLMKEEEFENISVEIVDQRTTTLTAIFLPSINTSSSHLYESLEPPTESLLSTPENICPSYDEIKVLLWKSRGGMEESKIYHSSILQSIPGSARPTAATVNSFLHRHLPELSISRLIIKARSRSRDACLSEQRAECWDGLGFR
ncbi:uncharacterized protein MELLADRAFT_101682 [Melampsora larici-populina 98AG31]|uniref:Uncharacterized protein n=1 Tax=Melampsora larici-populina (strain 98AG31 / pathotype 3-4-7) TaxID=747676 RepID=F4R6M5_MELLP|nr:uncharacterized protein MELLADRAFT_101682 [Melampsora larici-populina 98AG31]EGG12434.1 hypothetical protein MELLADRAFT_101682 [Melampsora larici-populina 98AG31]